MTQYERYRRSVAPLSGLLAEVRTLVVHEQRPPFDRSVETNGPGLVPRCVHQRHSPHGPDDASARRVEAMYLRYNLNAPFGHEITFRPTSQVNRPSRSKPARPTLAGSYSAATPRCRQET